MIDEPSIMFTLRNKAILELVTETEPAGKFVVSNYRDVIIHVVIETTLRLYFNVYSTCVRVVTLNWFETMANL